MIRNVRILVNGRDEVKAVQEFLFANDCQWNTGDREVRDLDDGKVSFFVSRSGNVTWGGETSFTATRNEDTPVLELTFQTKVTVVASKVKERPKTLLFGKMYYTSDVEKALAGLEPAK